MSEDLTGLGQTVLDELWGICDFVDQEHDVVEQHTTPERVAQILSQMSSETLGRCQC